MRTRWILVAGTGWQQGLAKETVWLAGAVGAALAREDYGLVVGGWHGVDYLAAQAFEQTLAAVRPRTPLADVMLQVVPKGTQPVFQGGDVVSVDPGPAEWVEALRFADAVVLIGGVGGTYRTFAHAMQERRAVFPIAGSGGDAAAAFAEMGQRWHVGGVWGLSRSSFDSVLSRAVRSEEASRQLTEDLMLLIADHLAFQEAEFHRDKLFVSYARTDREWLTIIKTQLRALPDQSIAVWDDSEIPPGTSFEREIQRAMAASWACLLLVTPEFLSSSFITERELPFLLRAHENELMRIFWVHIRRSSYEQTALGKIQAAHDPKRPFAKMMPSERQETLAQVCLQVARYMRERMGSDDKTLKL